MKAGAVKYVATILVQRALGLLLYLAGAGWVVHPKAAAYFTLYYTMTIISCTVMYHINKETLQERNKRNTNSPVWDKILLGIFWLLAFFGIYYVAGAEASQVSPSMGALFWLGLLLVLLSGAFTLWAVAVNTFLESTARIQEDRNQSVCQKGPYKIVRHPAYTSVIIWCAAFAFIFATTFVCVMAAVIALIIIVRTCFEDRMLQKQLSGYAEYTHKVKYRLFPYIW